MLECDFSFRLLVESKIKFNSIDSKQLEGIVNNSKQKNSIILYITPDSHKPKELENIAVNIIWANWKNINQIFHEISEQQPNQILNYLVFEFEKLLDYLNILDVTSPHERVQIAAGSWGEKIALEYGFYACQNNRQTKESAFLTFYNNRKFNHLFEIIEGPLNNTDLTKISELQATDYFEHIEPNLDANDLRQYYKLKLLVSDLNIKHEAVNNLGHKIPFTMGVFRYTTKEKLLKARTTLDL
jgi:hypothetical protein